MSGSNRCDEIIRLIDEALSDNDRAMQSRHISSSSGPLSHPCRPSAAPLALA